MSSLFEMGLAGRPLKDIFVFDTHAHGGPYHVRDLDGCMEAHLRRMDRAGVDVTCLMAYQESGGATLERHNDLVSAFINARPDRFKGYCWITANYPERILPELERCFGGLGFSGIKIYTYSGSYDDLRYAPMYEFAHARRLPILAHTWGDDSVRQLARMARQYPEAAFLVAHSGAGDVAINIEEALRTPNLYLELCFSGGTPWTVEHLVREVGADRLIWGSDATLFGIGQQLGKVLFADIPEDAKKQILGGNARRVFHMEEVPCRPSTSTR